MLHIQQSIKLLMNKEHTQFNKKHKIFFNYSLYILLIIPLLVTPSHSPSTLHPPLLL